MSVKTFFARKVRRTVALIVAAAAVAGCSIHGQSVIPHDLASASLLSLPIESPIKHIVIIVQENRSFENLFAGYPAADAPMYGYLHNGKRIGLHEVTFENNSDLDHKFAPSITAWNGGEMNGFDLMSFYTGENVRNYPYAYLDRAEVRPYWMLAKRYVLADHMFPTEFGPSFISHLALISGNTDLSSNLAEADYPTSTPWTCDNRSATTYSVNPRRVVSPNRHQPCFEQLRTMADTLDAARVSWRYYAPAAYYGGGLWSSFGAIPCLRYKDCDPGRGPGYDWKTKIVPETTVLTDAANGDLPAVSWVIPDWRWSDHPASKSDEGPSWVAAVVNAIGESRAWKSTAIVIVWDDWGGWYDDVAPPQPPVYGGTFARGDFRGLGIRVGCLIVSPYARAGQVIHTTYEFGSILKFVEETFGLPPLGSTADGYTDSRANSLIDAFDFSRPVFRFDPISAKYPASHFLSQPPSERAPDDE